MLRRVPSPPPTDYYDERASEIDEQICRLIKERKDVTDGKPGFPRAELLKEWAETYGLYEDLLSTVFRMFYKEDTFKPMVKPTGFIRNIPVMKSFEKDTVFYSVTFIRQYENASVIHLAIDRESEEEEIPPARERGFYTYNLTIKGIDHEYDCRIEGGGGSYSHTTFRYIVSPSLRDDLSAYQFTFEQRHNLKPTGFTFTI